MQIRRANFVLLVKFRLIEFAAGRGLLRADAAGDDIRLRVIFAANWRAGEAPEQRQLADVRQRIGDRALKEFFRRAGERGIGGEIIIESLYGGEETPGAFVPSEWGGIVPVLFAVGLAERPVEQISQVREDLAADARGVAGAKFREAWRSALQYLAAAIGERRDAVAQEVTAGACSGAFRCRVHSALIIGQILVR